MDSFLFLVPHFRAAASSAISSFEEPLLCSCLFFPALPPAAAPGFAFQEAEAPPTDPFASDTTLSGPHCILLQEVFLKQRLCSTTLVFRNPRCFSSLYVDDDAGDGSNDLYCISSAYYTPGKTLYTYTIFTSYNSCALISAVQVRKLRICVLK